ncbi:MAG: Clp protease N-terminal domain-containing protein [Hyphomicrobiaceae bacterium]
MQYKGDDLDLRVPHVRAQRDFYVPDFEHTPNGRWSRSQSFGVANNEPLWVDEPLLACCNYAFDVAQANGAAEVDLEHLVNALTRVEAAARILENRGVREGYLRRESAALIASEVPAANAGDAVSPRRSADVEDVLRHATELAHRRGSPAGVEDVLWVLLHYGRDLPVVQLLRRLTPDWQRLDWLRIREPQLSETASSRPASMQLVANDSVHSRVISVEDSLRLMQSEFAAERKLLMDLVRDIQRDVVAQRGDSVAFRGDLGQRLDGLERAVGARSETRTQAIVVDRLTHLEQSVQSGLSEALRSTRDLAQRLGKIEGAIADVKATPASGVIAERMAALEKAVHSGLGEGARNWAHLGQRLNKFEAGFGAHGDAAGLEAIGERIAGLERVVETSLAESARNFGQLGQHLAALQTSGGGDGPLNLVEALDPRLVAIERRLERKAGETEREQGAVVAHLETVEQTLELGRNEMTRAQAEMADRLSAIETYLSESPVVASSGDAADTHALTDRLSGLERAVRAGFGDAAATLSQIAERLVSVERSVFDRPQDGDSAFLLEDRLGSLDSHGRQALTVSREIVERLRVLEQRPSDESASVTDASVFVTPLTQKLATLEDTSIARIDAVQTAIDAIATRLDQFDERMRAESVVTEEALRGRDQDFDFIYNEIKEVAQSQATLNSAVSDWRTESQEHFGALASRLDKLHPQGLLRPSDETTAPTARPIQLPGTPPQKDGADVTVDGTVSRVDDTGDVTVKADDYTLPPEPRRGFRYWLFGTTSLSAAHRQNALQVSRMRTNIRETRERRRTEV